MDKRWNLDKLYKGFDDSFINDMNGLEEMLNSLKKYPELVGNEENLVDYLLVANQLNDKVGRLFHYVNLVRSIEILFKVRKYDG